MYIFNSMDDYLQPLVSCYPYYDNHQAEKERFWRNRKNIAKRMFTLRFRIILLYVYVCVCVCVCVDYICVLLCVLVYVIVCMFVYTMIHAPRGRFDVVS